jgi:hypothetical protein
VWMPEEHKSLTSLSGIEVAGKIVTKVEQRHTSAGGQSMECWVFRILDEKSDQTIPVTFEGGMTAMLDHGDHVRVQGFLVRGVLQARRIVDEHGAVLGETRCFVATAVVDSPNVPELQILRRFRDQVLLRSVCGRAFVAWYWRVGPRLAVWVQCRPRVRWIIRCYLLDPLCHLLMALYHFPSTPQDTLTDPEEFHGRK